MPSIEFTAAQAAQKLVRNRSEVILGSSSLPHRQLRNSAHDRGRSGWSTSFTAAQAAQKYDARRGPKTFTEPFTAAQAAQKE